MQQRHGRGGRTMFIPVDALSDGAVFVMGDIDQSLAKGSADGTFGFQWLGAPATHLLSTPAWTDA